PSVIGYVESDPTIFADPDSTPRSWAYVSTVLHAQAGARPTRDSVRAAVAGLVGAARAAAFLRFVEDRVRPLTADEVLNGYPDHREELRRWVRAGKLDLVHGSLMSVLRFFQSAPNYEAARGSSTCWHNLGLFLRDLPGDLREEAQVFFNERGYALPPG